MNKRIMRYLSRIAFIGLLLMAAALSIDCVNVSVPCDPTGVAAARA